jgi:hypothetical protein
LVAVGVLLWDVSVLTVTLPFDWTPWSRFLGFVTQGLSQDNLLAFYLGFVSYSWAKLVCSSVLSANPLFYGWALFLFCLGIFFFFFDGARNDTCEARAPPWSHSPAHS